MGLLFGLLVLSFAIWGIGDTFRSGQHTGVVAQVGDQEITETEFRRAFNLRYSQLQQQLGGGLSSDMMRDLGLPEAVLGQLVTRGLLDQQAADLGLVVTDDQVRSAIFSQTAFRDSLGQFDRFRFEQFLRANDMTEAAFAQEIRRETIQRRISTALTRGAEVPDLVARMLYAYQEQRRSARYVSAPLPPADSIAAPDEAELQSFYETVQDRFRSPEYRKISALWIRPEDFFDEISLDETTLSEEYEIRRDTLVTPEEREVEQIVLSSQDTVDAAGDAIAQHSDLVALGEALDAGPPISIGRFSKRSLSDSLGDEVAELTFSLSQGEIGGPVRSDFGWHIIRVVDIAEGSDPSFEEVREELTQLLQRERAIEAVVSLANQLDDALAGGAGLEGASEQLAIPLLTFPQLDATGRDRSGERPEGLPEGESFLQMVRQTELGEESFLAEDGREGYFVLRVDEIMPPANRPLSEVRQEILAAYVEDRRRQAALEQAERIAERIRQGASLDEAADEEGLPVEESDPVTRFERNPVAVPAGGFAPALFAAGENEPFIVEGQSGALVGVLAATEAASPDTDDARFQDVQQRLRQERAGEMLQVYLADLQGRYGVSTNQATIDYILSGF